LYGFPIVVIGESIGEKGYRKIKFGDVDFIHVSGQDFTLSKVKC
jgi:arginine/lysine/ornithine decarboxylase